MVNAMIPTRRVREGEVKTRRKKDRMAIIFEGSAQ